MTEDEFMKEMTELFWDEDFSSDEKSTDNEQGCNNITISLYDKYAAWNEDFCFVDYRSKGVTYKIPKLTGSPRGGVGTGLYIGVDDDACLKMKDYARTSVYLYESLRSNNLRFSITASGPVCEDGERQLVALYKVGSPLPLRTMLCPDVCHRVKLEVPCNTSEYTYGNYFLLVCGADITDDTHSCVTMGDNVRFDFSLLSHGEAMEHPAVKDISMKMRCSQPSTLVSMHIAFDKAQTAADEYVAVCVAENYDVVDKQCVFAFNKNRKNATASAFWEKLWVAGCYNVYVMHNGEPFYRAKFHYGDYAFELVEQATINVASPDYMLVKYLLSGERQSKWMALAAVPGYTAAKEKVIAHVKSMVMNDLRKGHRKRQIESSGNYCIDTFDEDFLDAFLPLTTSYDSYNVGDCNQFVEPKYTVDPLEDVNEFISSCSGKVMLLKNVGALLTPNGKAVLSRIENWLESSSYNSLFLCGTPSETTSVLESSPTLRRYFPRENFIVREYYTLVEQVHEMKRIINSYDYSFDNAAECSLIELLTDARSKGVSCRWRSEELKSFFLERIYPRICERVMAGGCYYNRATSNAVGSVTSADLNITFGERELSPYEATMSELKKMVGLGNLKEHLNLAFNNMKFDEMRRNAGLAVASPAARHMIFTGNPGTGKTTVAKKVGRIFHALGLLSKGEVIATERTQLVGRYIGETERNMQRVLEQARGNVLFIDEAYTLYCGPEDRRDFGRHVIDALLTVLAQPNPDILVIMAGYKKEMDRMMLMNQGLAGRFPFKFHFDDYSADELMQIAVSLLSKNDYVLQSDAAEALHNGIKNACDNKDAHFSNARWVEQLVMDGVVPAMSSRVMSAADGEITREMLTLICRSDVDVAFENFGYAAKKEPMRRCVGFSY